MNMLTFYIIITLSWLHSNAFAQRSPQYFFSKIPELPCCVCLADNETIARWNENIMALKNEMLALKAHENESKERAMARAKASDGVLIASNGEKIQETGERIQAVETNINILHERLVSSYIEIKSSIELKFYGRLDKLEDQEKKCEECAQARHDYLTNYRNSLDTLIELGILGNKLSDEMTSLCYSGYNFQTKYGIWLDCMISYVNELSHVYEDLPEPKVVKP